MPSFRIHALPAAPFAGLGELSPDELAARGIQRVRADASPGYPCRVSLRDAAIGERVWLLSYAHLAVDSPYRASGPIFVRIGATEATPAPGEVPDSLRARLLSLRAYDAVHRMVAAEVCDGERVAAALERLFARAEVDIVHLHNAKPGCYAAVARRVAVAA